MDSVSVVREMWVPLLRVMLLWNLVGCHSQKKRILHQHISQKLSVQTSLRILIANFQSLEEEERNFWNMNFGVLNNAVVYGRVPLGNYMFYWNICLFHYSILLLSYSEQTK